MSVEEKKLLTDIVLAIYSIDEHLEGKRIFTEYKSNKTKRRAVERELEIIGEAVNKLLKITPEISISYARLIVDLRNKVIHYMECGYESFTTVKNRGRATTKSIKISSNS